jgi:hypothetical protein
VVRSGVDGGSSVSGAVLEAIDSGFGNSSRTISRLKGSNPAFFQALAMFEAVIATCLAY